LLAAAPAQARRFDLGDDVGGRHLAERLAQRLIAALLGVGRKTGQRRFAIGDQEARGGIRHVGLSCG
jgi:hypothetical protein